MSAVKPGTSFYLVEIVCFKRLQFHHFLNLYRKKKMEDNTSLGQGQRLEAAQKFALS